MMKWLISTRLLIPLLAFEILDLDILLPFSTPNKNGSATNQKSFFSKTARNTSSDLPVISFKYNANGSDVYGHRTVVQDPLNMLSIALTNGGCEKDSLRTVMEISKQHQCDIAVNAGLFFSGKCIGTLISDRYTHVVSGDSKMVQFGIKANGNTVFGYHLENDIKNPFIHLVSGFGWLIRDGEIFVNQSFNEEKCDMSNLNKLFYEKSARTLVGHDVNGWIHIIQIDGKTGQFGLTLPEASAYLKSLGIVNGINLDGGGSSSFVINQVLVNYPSNFCMDERGQKVLCASNVSSILCVRKHGYFHSMVHSSLNLLFCCRHSSNAIIGLCVLLGAFLIVALLLCKNFMHYRSRFINLTKPILNEEKLQAYLNRITSNVGKNNIS